MKSTCNRLFASWIIAFLAISCCQKITGSPGAQVINLDESNSGKTLIVSKSQIFTLTLFDKVDGGYKFDKPQYDSTVLRLEKLAEKPPAPNSPPGSPGQDTWQFTTLKKGKTALTVTATRPWTGGGSIAIFSNIVIVK